MLRAVILHPEPLVRRFVRDRLSDEVTVVAEASTAEDGAILVAETQPDLVFADLLLTGENGFQLALRLRCEQPEAITILLTDAADAALIPYLNRIAQENGAAGVLPYAALSDETLYTLAA